MGVGVVGMGMVVGLKVFALLTHRILVDSSTVICWTNLFAILGVSSLFCHFILFL